MLLFQLIYILLVTRVLGSQPISTETDSIPNGELSLSTDLEDKIQHYQLLDSTIEKKDELEPKLGLHTLKPKIRSAQNILQHIPTIAIAYALNEMAISMGIKYPDYIQWSIIQAFAQVLQAAPSLEVAKNSSLCMIVGRTATKMVEELGGSVFVNWSLLGGVITLFDYISNTYEKLTNSSCEDRPDENTLAFDY